MKKVWGISHCSGCSKKYITDALINTAINHHSGHYCINCYKENRLRIRTHYIRNNNDSIRKNSNIEKYRIYQPTTPVRKKGISHCISCNKRYISEMLCHTTIKCISGTYCINCIKEHKLDKDRYFRKSRIKSSGFQNIILKNNNHIEKLRIFKTGKRYYTKW